MTKEVIIMENKEFEFDYFDPIYSEYNPLSDEIKNEIQKLIESKKEKDGHFCPLVIRKLMPVQIIQQG